MNEESNYKEPIDKASTEGDTEQPTVKEYFGIGEVFTYWFRKKDPNRPSSFNLRAMHTINKISMATFLIAFLIWLARRLF